MIYVTGDTHGMIDFAKLKLFANQHSNLTKKDYVIIAGDFGGVWSEKTLQENLLEYEKLPFSILFVDGNHENFDLLNSFEVSIWNGGKIHQISENIIHLMRGQVFEIDGVKIFTLGGARSVDKAGRIEHISWWEEEEISDQDMQEAVFNLKHHQNKVDYIITHSCDERALYYPPLRNKNQFFYAYLENRLLSYFEENVTYKHWYFGHYHLDGDLNDKKTVLYDQIIPLGESILKSEE